MSVIDPFCVAPVVRRLIIIIGNALCCLLATGSEARQAELSPPLGSHLYMDGLQVYTSTPSFSISMPWFYSLCHKRTSVIPQIIHFTHVHLQLYLDIDLIRHRKYIFVNKNISVEREKGGGTWRKLWVFLLMEIRESRAWSGTWWDLRTTRDT